MNCRADVVLTVAVLPPLIVVPPAGAQPEARTTNLLANPGFEEVKADTAWPVAWTQLRGEPVVLQDDGGHTGDRYVRFTDTRPDEGVSLESDHRPARPGGTYRASAWVRTTDTCQPGVYIQFHGDVGDRIHEVHERATGPTDGWVQLEVTAEAPNEAAEVSVLLYAYIGDVGGFDFDDVALTVEGGTEPGSYGVPRAEPGGREPVEIGSRLELFVDDFIVDSLTGDASRRLHHPAPQNIALSFDQPWEGPTSFYVTAFQDDDRVRLYYRGSGHEGTHQVTCYAESPDGITFSRPGLGLFEFEGSKENSIIWTGEGAHNFAPFKDPNPACKPEERYKAVAGGPLIAVASADGINWEKMQEEPVITEGAFDSQNLAFWDEVRGEYVCYLRDGKDGFRWIRRATSKDFINWTTPEWLDFGEAPKEHLYTNAITPYFRAPHILLGFPKRFVPARKKVAEHEHAGVSDGVLMSSRDGLHFERWLEAFLRPGPDPKRWTERNNHIAWGLIPTSEMLTRPLVFAGSRLLVNYSTSAVGWLRFELCDEAGEPLEGLAFRDSEVLFGDEIEHEVSWGEGDVGALARRPVRLRVRLKDADLYSFRFAE